MGVREISLHQVVRLEVNGRSVFGAISDITRAGVWIETNRPAADLPAIEPQATAKFCLRDAQGDYEQAVTILEVQPAPTVRLRVTAPPDLPAFKRRQFHRTEVTVPVLFCQHPDELATCAAPFSGKTQDLSAGGVLLETPSELRTQAYVSLRISLPAIADQPAADVSTKGIVRESKRAGRFHLVGVAFSKISEADEQRILRFLFALQCEQLATGRSG